ncbi:hypothetical protein PENTCL1PPCAC_29406, partial [Pristionchus entomophagus]
FDAAKSVYLVDGLRRNEANIHIIDDETFPNGLSSTRIRIAIRRGENVRYSLPDKVLSYINQHRLYHASPQQRSAHLREVEERCELPPVPPRPVQQPPIPPPPKRTTSVKTTTGPLVPPRMSQSMHCNLATISHPLVPSNSAGDIWEISPSTYTQPQVSASNRESPRQSGVSSAKTTPDHRMTQSMIEQPSPSSSTKGKLTVGGAINVSRCEIPPKSPDYDNVTIDELLEASNCWAHYMNDQYRQIQNRPRIPADRVISAKEDKGKTTSCSPTKGPKKLFRPFMRSNSKTNSLGSKSEEKCNCAELYEQDFYGYREMMRERKCDCGSYLGPGEDDPRLMAVHANRSIRRENGTTVEQQPAITQRSILSGAEGSSDRKSSRDHRSIRFATNMTKSMDSIPSMKVNGGNGGDVMSRSTNPSGFASDDNQVTLSFTRYRLSATPETTV